EPALVEAHDHGGQKHRGEQNHQWVADVGGGGEEGFSLDVPRRVRCEKLGQDFLCSVHQAPCPARLLSLSAVHSRGELHGALAVRQVEELPAFELGAIRKVGVFGQRVVLPAARGFNGSPAPDAGGAVEIEKSASTGASAVFDDEVAVEKNGFDLSEQ